MGRCACAPRFRGRRVLVVDDNEDGAQTLADALTAHGFDVRVASDGLRALALSRTFRPQVAFLDIGLPVMNGYDLAREPARTCEGIRLIAVTGYGQASDRKRTSDAGFAAHVVKPVDIDELVALASQAPTIESLSGGESAHP